MDELKITSNFMKGLIRKAVLKSKLGDYICDMLINSITVTVGDSDVRIHLDVNASLKKEALSKLILEKLLGGGHDES